MHACMCIHGNCTTNSYPSYLFKTIITFPIPITAQQQIRISSTCSHSTDNLLNIIFKWKICYFLKNILESKVVPNTHSNPISGLPLAEFLQPGHSVVVAQLKVGQADQATTGKPLVLHSLSAGSSMQKVPSFWYHFLLFLMAMNFNFPYFISNCCPYSELAKSRKVKYRPLDFHITKMLCLYLCCVCACAHSFSCE